MTERTRWRNVAVGPLPDPVKDDLRAAFDARFVDALAPAEIAAAMAGIDVLLVTSARCGHARPSWRCRHR